MGRQIYIVGGGKGYANWMEGTIVDRMEDADLVVFTGGEDVSPSLYGESQHKLTWNNKQRDTREVMEWSLAQKLGKHIIGICRGSQLSCALSGGKLVQHQDNPKWVHDIRIIDPKWDGTRGMIQIDTVPITSTHHQAMYPYNLPKEEYKILGWTEGMLQSHQNGNMEEMLQDGQVEVEICYFPKTKALGIQGHPEMMSETRDSETITHLRSLLDAHLNDKL